MWVLSQRKTAKTPNADDRDIVFLTEQGKPIWHGTEHGHVSDGLSNVWYRLVRRVRKDHPDFPPYSFNKLRKTSATRILEIADAETASMILAHKTISEDDLLHHYALLPWNKLYAAQKSLENQLAPVLEVGGSDPWAIKPKTYIGLVKTKQVTELRSAGVSASAIAERLKISLATVYRLLQAKKERTAEAE
jgi:Helix-turn-helix domain of resolvase